MPKFYTLNELIPTMREEMEKINPTDPYHDFDSDIKKLTRADCCTEPRNFLWNVNKLGTHLMDDNYNGRDMILACESTWPESKTWRISKMANGWVMIPRD